MDAIILAGGRTDPDDPLNELTQGGNKALLPVAGKPMVQWILDALGNSALIERVALVGLPDDTPVQCAHPLLFVEDFGSIIRNIKAGAEALLRDRPDLEARALSISSDIPAITPESIDWLVKAVNESEHDIYYCVVERRVMETRFPGSRRSYINLKGLEVCGGDMNAVRLGEAIADHELVEQLTANRKNPLKQASLVGFDILFRLLSHRLSVQEAEKRIGKRLKLRGRVIVNPFAEVAMDVDKPFQLEIMEKDLLTRA